MRDDIAQGTGWYAGWALELVSWPGSPKVLGAILNLIYRKGKMHRAQQTDSHQSGETKRLDFFFRRVQRRWQERTKDLDLKFAAPVCLLVQDNTKRTILGKMWARAREWLLTARRKEETESISRWISSVRGGEGRRRGREAAARTRGGWSFAWIQPRWC